MKKSICWLILFVATAGITSTAVATKKVLVVSGDRASQIMHKTVDKAIEKYQNAGWNVTAFHSYQYSDPLTSLRTIVTGLGPWQAIYLVAHGCFAETAEDGAFDLDKEGGGSQGVLTDSLARWFRQSTVNSPDEVILHACELGREPELADKFRNPRYFLAWDYKTDIRIWLFYEYLHHQPRPGGKSASILSTAHSAVGLTLSAAPIECIGYHCCDGSCVDFDPVAQIYVDSALVAMQVGAEYLDTDVGLARAKLAEAKKHFTAALDYELDTPKAWILVLHINWINSILYAAPTLTPIGLIIFGFLILASSCYLQWRRTLRHRMC